VSFPRGLQRFTAKLFANYWGMLWQGQRKQDGISIITRIGAFLHGRQVTLGPFELAGYRCRQTRTGNG